MSNYRNIRSVEKVSFDVRNRDWIPKKSDKYKLVEDKNTKTKNMNIVSMHVEAVPDHMAEAEQVRMEYVNRI